MMTMPMAEFSTGSGLSARCSASMKRNAAEPAMKADCPSPASGSALPWPKRCSRSAGVTAWRRARHRADAESRGHLGDAQLERSRTLDGTRLVGGPGADLAQARPRGEILVGLRRRHRLDRALDTDLAAQRLPMKADCRPGMRG